MEVRPGGVGTRECTALGEDGTALRAWRMAERGAGFGWREEKTHPSTSLRAGSGQRNP